MLTPRNIILIAVFVAVFSLAWTVIGVLRPPDANQLRADTYGTRHHGFKAAFETLRELGIDARRNPHPPKPDDLTEAVVVFWKPLKQLVASEPSWLQDLQQAVRDGGQVVIADDGRTLFSRDAVQNNSTNQSGPRLQAMVANPDESIVELLGVRQLTVRPDEADTTTIATGRTQRPSKPLAEVLTGARPDVAKQTFQLRATGDFATAGVELKTLVLPVGQLNEIRTSGQLPESAIFVTDANGNERCIAARVALGSGSVTIVGTPWILSNGGITEADNVLVAALVLLHGDRPIVFDEFFHGLAARGNPIWLFSQRTYGTIALALLTLTGVVVWRGAIFLGPPLPAPDQPRRSVREYIDAMGRFMCEGRYHDQWMLTQLRDGVLWQLRQEHGLPPEQHSEQELLTHIGRRNPTQADTLRTVLNDVDHAVSGAAPIGLLKTIQLLQRIRECLSSNSTARSAAKLTK
jgi:hypothetical protein